MHVYSYIYANIACTIMLIAFKNMYDYNSTKKTS